MAYEPSKLYLPEAPPVVVDEVGQLLLDAATLIRRKGHAKFALTDKTGAHCILGAINMCAFGEDGCPAGASEYQWRNLWAAQDRLYRVIGTDSELRWNNAPERTAAEVIAALEAAAVQP